MEKIEKIIKKTTLKNQDKTNWTKAWSNTYPILKRYQNEVDIKKYSKAIRELFTSLEKDYNYSELDAMLVLKDILAHEYLDNIKKD